MPIYRITVEGTKYVYHQEGTDEASAAEAAKNRIGTECAGGTGAIVTVHGTPPKKFKIEVTFKRPDPEHENVDDVRYSVTPIDGDIEDSGS